ncbi:MAG TPA: vWA domain-containing protein, partial [Vicinamibacterales bacterium]|nr:vWA domain-containing protein [Vicinamibacterales bacterium]
MDVSLTAPGALWLLAVVPLVWLARRFGRTNFNPRQQLLQAVFRSLVLAALALALARPVISMGSSRMAVVYLVDVSHSVASRAITEAAAKIDALNTETKPSHWRIVAFGADATVLESTAALRDLGALDPASPNSPVRRDTTDLERALRQARSELLPGHVPGFVLFSDGRPTAGDVSEAIASLVAEGIPVSVVPLPARDVGDAWVDGVRWPQRLTAGALTPAVVTIGSQRAANALVELRAGGRQLAS